MAHLDPAFLDRTTIDAAVKLLVGRPELVVVDARVLRLLMGDLAGLIILGTVEGGERMVRELSPGEEPFAWGDGCP